MPRDRVLPLFVSLGATRATITEEVRLLVAHQRLVDRLAELAQAAQPVLLRSALGGNASVASLPRAQELGAEEVEQASLVGCLGMYCRALVTAVCSKRLGLPAATCAGVP